MLHRLRVLAVTLPMLLGACATTPAAPAPPRGSRFVLVPLSVPLRQRPRARAAALRLRPGGTSMEVAVFRRVRARGAWVQVEAPSRPERQCHPTLALPHGLRVRFWVRSDELAPALTRTITRDASDGSSLVARAGLRVVPEGDLSHVALAPGTQLALPLRGDEVGDSFAEPRPFSLGEPDERLVGEVNVPFLGAGRFMTTRGAPAVYVTERRAVDGAHLARVRTRCAELRVRVLPRHVVPVVDVDVQERAREEAASGERVTVPAGTRLRWPDGALAGRVLQDIELAPEVRRIGAMPCYSIPVTIPAIDGLRPSRIELCAEPPRES